MEERKPLKRHKALQPFSREHHHGLLLCWKIRKGFLSKVDPVRVKTYSDWFYKTHLIPHFSDEEKYIFPILGEEHEHIKKAMAEHRRLARLFDDKEDIARNLNRIEEELERHIRFEERVLFPEIQDIATPEQLELMTQMHDSVTFKENNEDPFWL
ncbi:hemerythrin domain-containing protein [Roseivirga echinicomitans]|uniref:Cation-binding protein n=1 Tax=Roseivirga echinicomitans TaxID=296218 RepID=A0A150X9S8_9BACT|nr:hemerythrin domain-containing protein [Roseivirga echinicomitans]KYG75497.1 cation-binding protein [Roseivirga echinicomitans]